MSSQATVLLVEDNDLNRDMLARRLKRSGFPVTTARDGREALDIMVAEQPDLVLMDMNLPVLDGWTACRQAREDSRIRAIPIIALTAHALDADRRQALDAGCSDYATKPVDFTALLDKIQALTRP